MMSKNYKLYETIKTKRNVMKYLKNFRGELVTRKVCGGGGDPKIVRKKFDM